MKHQAKNSNKITGQYRQGDVLIQKSDSVFDLDTAKVVPPDQGKVILAYGEVSGHAHSFTIERTKLYESNGDRVLEVIKPDIFKHGNPGNEDATKDHNFIPVAKGRYKVTQQTEYSPAELRNVAD